MPYDTANASARSRVRDPMATTSASGTCSKSATKASAMAPVPAMPHRVVMAATLGARTAGDRTGCGSDQCFERTAQPGGREHRADGQQEQHVEEVAVAQHRGQEVAGPGHDVQR